MLASTERQLVSNTPSIAAELRTLLKDLVYETDTASPAESESPMVSIFDQPELKKSNLSDSLQVHRYD